MAVFPVPISGRRNRTARKINGAAHIVMARQTTRRRTISAAVARARNGGKRAPRSRTRIRFDEDFAALETFRLLPDGVRSSKDLFQKLLAAEQNG
jgi:hypothetical protein